MKLSGMGASPGFEIVWATMEWRASVIQKKTSRRGRGRVVSIVVKTRVVWVSGTRKETGRLRVVVLR